MASPDFDLAPRSPFRALFLRLVANGRCGGYPAEAAETGHASLPVLRERDSAARFLEVRVRVQPSGKLLRQVPEVPLAPNLY